MHTKIDKTLPRFTLAAVTALLATGTAWAQSTAASIEADDEDVIVLSPFEVQASEDNQGYAAASTLAGNRLNTELRDIGNAVTVITSQFLKDIAATDNESLLQYTTGTEVGNIDGNFAGVGDGASLDESSRFTNPNQNTRVRGLAAADSTRDFFISDIPWDGYNVDRVDLQRGPNSILFGQGSPAGIINTGLKQAAFKNSNEVAFRVASYGSVRASVDFNRVLMEDQLSVRVAAVEEQEKFQQDPAFQDNSRIYGAVRFEPEFLKRGSARTIIKANVESGSIDSNRPRSLPPIDLITPWFDTGTYEGTFTSNGQIRDPSTGVVSSVTAGQTRIFPALNRATFNPHQLQDDNSGRPNVGQARPKINGGDDSGFFSPYYQPWLGNYGQQYGGPNGFFATDGGAPSYWLWEVRTTRGIGPDGADDNGVGEFAFHRPAGIATQASFARNAGLPFAEFGVYKNNNLTDSSVFDFYNNLLDGPNKWEWQDWDAFNVSIAQTFMNDKFGFEAVFNKEDYNNGQVALLSGDRQAIYIDFMSVYSDGRSDVDADGFRFNDGTPNPNVGRAFISDSGQGGNNSFESERESSRITAFFTHDFTRGGKDNWLSNLLGSHTFTGLWAEDERNTDARSWNRYAVLDQSYIDMVDAGAGARFNDNLFSVNRIIYLGGSLLNSPSASGANLPRPNQLNNATSGTIRFFDSTWNATGVDPAAYWANEYYPVGSDARDSTQSENSSNYVGWVDVPFQITDSEESQANRDALTTYARLQRRKVESEAIVWQAKLFDGGLVGTYGWREDTAGGAEYSQNVSSRTANRGFLELTPDYYNLDAALNRDTDGATWSELTEESTSYSIVAHLDQLPFIGQLTEKLPVSVSFFYNNAENFQPEAARVDVYGDPIPLPSGTTTDQGILLETRDGKYSLKVNKYETAVTNASASGLGGAWFLGASQSWSSQWVNIFEYNWNGNDASTAAGPGEDSSRYNWQDNPAGEAAAIAAWRQWQSSEVAQKMYSAWQIDPTRTSSSVSHTNPAGFSLSEDTYSEGWEVELNAQPTRNWRLTLNASKTFATRKNIGGANLAEFVDAYQEFLKGPGGDLRIWWGGAGNETALYQWNANVGSELAARRLQEGTNVPELREWRFNAISNYDFSEGILKGVNVGGAVRYQSSVVIGYPPVLDGTDISFDLANPYEGPAETYLDLWVGYSKKLSDRIDWRIQLNVRNLGEGNGLIPITSQPDGTPAGYRIAPHQSWSLTNTFRF